MAWEGFVARPYVDPVGIWTQGYGETEGVDAGDPAWTEAYARQRLLKRANDDYGKAVLRCIVRPLNQNQFDAYVSFTYNVGIRAFCTSTLAKLHNAGDETGACNQLTRWNKAGGRVLRGLVNRRAAERALCLKEPS